jgi:Tol biopolymer transport system component
MGTIPSGPIRALAFLLAGAAVAAGPACGRKAAERPDGLTQAADPASWKPETTFVGAILFQSDSDGDNEIYSLTRDGVRKLTDNSWSDEYPRWSPDGTKIAFTANPKGQFDIFAMNADGTGIAPVVETPADETEPDWRPDGSGLAFTRDDALWMLDFATRLEKRLVPEFNRAHGILDFSPAAPIAAFTGKRALGWDVYLLDVASGRPTPMTSGGKSCRPRFSPDGRTIAFVSSAADGMGDVWTMRPDGTGKTRMTETGETADYFPSWSPDGKEIVFCSGTEHSPKRGRWTLHILDAETRKTRPLFSAAERALFPDWR